MPSVYLVFEVYREYMYNRPVETFSLIAAFHKRYETKFYVEDAASAARRLARQAPDFYWVTRVNIGDIGGRNDTIADWYKKFGQQTQVFNAGGKPVVQGSDFDGGENELSLRTPFWVVLSQETSNDNPNPNPDRVRGVYTKEEQAHERIANLDDQETVRIGIVPVHGGTVFNQYVSLWETQV